MLRNLVGNAIDYTTSSGSVQLGCRRRGPQLRDNGVGISPERLARIFEAFERGDNSCSDGLGLGLFIVKRAAELLDHRIEVRSAVGRGYCFALLVRAVDFAAGGAFDDEELAAPRSAAYASERDAPFAGAQNPAAPPRTTRRSPPQN
jgi:signal transduction histidine kinase